MFVLVHGLPPLKEPSPADHDSGIDRVTRKFKMAQADRQKVLNACAETQRMIARDYDQRNGIVLVGDDGVAQRLPLHSEPPSIKGAVKEIMAWNDVERRDNYENHVEKNLELWKLPTSRYDIRPFPPLSCEEQGELDAYRQQQLSNPAAPIVVDADTEVSEMDTEDLYERVREQIKGTPREGGFWEKTATG
jgi:hypothetical protein